MKSFRKLPSMSRTTRRISSIHKSKLWLHGLEDRVVPTITLLPQTVNSTEGAAFNGTVIALTDSRPTASAMDFNASIDWGDGHTSPADGKGVTVIADPNVPRQFDVHGTHTYVEDGNYNLAISVTDLIDNSQAVTSSFRQTNLVTDDQSVLASLGQSPAAHTDPNLVNPWGIAFAPTGPFWVADNGAGVSTLYDGTGSAQALVVTVPASSNPGATAPAPVTGVVFNPSATDFNVAGAGTAAHFIFVTEDGTIAAWNSGTTAVLKVDNSNFTTGRVYKGVAIGNNGTANFIYAANFRAGTIDVFDTNFANVNLAGSFTDPNIPAGFAPFDIQNINGQLFVTYAMQDAAKHDDVAGAGNGFVNVFDLNGNFVRRFASQGTLNSPWGLAIAPASFVAFANALLVGNFGDGRISAFNASTGAFLGQLSDSHNLPIAIPGLWGLKFGNNGTAGSASSVFFTAGINDEADGLFGNLVFDQSASASVADAPLLPGSGAMTSVTAFSGVGGNNTSTTAGTANAALSAFESAIGGVNNGGTASPQSGGFRTINWDGVKLDGTDFGGSTTVVDNGHVVGIPLNRFQERGTHFDAIYAVSGPASATDTSTFSTVNPTVGNLFSAFSPSNTFAMFNDNTIDFHFVLPSNHGTTPVPAESHGFGAIFKNVHIANTTSIEYFNGDTSLGKFFVPVGGAGQAEFLGELFDSPIITSVSFVLGTDVLFSFNGTNFSAGGTDDPVNGHNLVVTDDFAYAEPVPLTTGQSPVNATATVPLTNVAVATFTDTSLNGAATDYTGTIDWGDGHSSPATFTHLGALGSFTVSGTNTYAAAGTFAIHVQVQDFGGSIVDLFRTAIVTPTVHYFAVGADAGGGPEVKVYNAATGAIKFDFMAYDATFKGGVRVATGDVNGDGVDDIITGAGAGGGPHVKVFDGVTGAEIHSFFAYDASFTGGVYVAAGDVNDDGKEDIVTGAGAGGGPHVKVFDGTNLGELASFFAYAPGFAGGVRVAAGDVNDDGHADIITGAGPGGGPHVKVFSGTNLALLKSFYAFDASFSGGVYVAAGDIDGNGHADIITGAGAGGTPHLIVYSGVDLAVLQSFDAYNSAFAGGVRVGAVDFDADGKADIITGAGPGGGPHVRAFRGTDLKQLDSFYAFDPSFMGGVFVG
jgi:uncharacterized protein (TIGR03118 family)